VSRLAAQVTTYDLEGAALIVALKHAEHYLLLQERYPAWAEMVEFWHVDDAPAVLGLIEQEVMGLVARLLGGGQPQESQPTEAAAGRPAVKEAAKRPVILQVGKETAGRPDKGLTTVFDLLLELAALLKQRCGTGGTLKDGRIEIQGGQRERIVAELEKLGYKVIGSGAEGAPLMLPLYHDPHFTFRFAEARIIPRFHLESVEAGRRVSIFEIAPGTGERLGLLATATVGEGGWVAQVVDGAQEQLPQRHQPGFAVDGGALTGVGSDDPERVARLSSGDGHQIEFFFAQVVVLVAQRLRVDGSVRTEQKRSIHRPGTLHAVVEELLAVGDKADRFERTPLAGDRTGAQLLAGHPGHGDPQFFDAFLVSRDQVCGGERIIVPLGSFDR
jgi:translation initiation factor 1 (eIF-1/SUI1)